MVNTPLFYCESQSTINCIVGKCYKILNFSRMYLAIVIIILCIVLLSYRRKNPRLPPGPSWQIPLLGHLPFLGPHLGKSMLALKKKYGPVTSVKMGAFDTVILGDAKVIKEAFNSPALAGRPHMHYFQAGTQHKGIMFSDGPELSEQRQFTLRTLKDFGFRSTAMEDNIHDEISHLLQEFEREVGKTITVHQTFGLSVVNGFWSCLTGKPFAHNDGTLAYLASLINKLTELPNFFETLSTFVPLLSKLFPDLSGFNGGLKAYQDLHKFMAGQIEELDKSRVKGQPTNFTEAYLDKMDDTTDEKSSFFPTKGYQPIAYGDLFLGAIDTSSSAIAWTLAYLSQYLEQQRKLQKEISEIVGESRAPCLADRPSMPYAEAVINEILRIASIAPIGIGHRATEDTILRNYLIPKDTLIMQNLYGVFHDPDVWGDPEVFRPERFIDDTGKFKRVDELIPFGSGKRACPGESLARDQLFLYITSIFQKFSVNYVGSPPNLDAKFAFILKPDPYQIVFTNRS